MKDLETLIEICRKKGQRSIQLVNQNFRKKEISKDNQLYQGITSGQFLSDQDAARSIFKSDHNSRNYRNAKSKLKQKLLNHLYFLDYEKESYTQRDRVHYELCHQLHQSKILIDENAPEIAQTLLQQVVKSAEQYEFSEIMVPALQLLLRLHAYFGKTSLYTETVAYLEQARSCDQALQECQLMYFEVLAKINKSQSSQHKVLKEMPIVITRINQINENHRSDRLEVMAQKLALTYCRLTSDFQGVLDLANEIEEKYLSVPQSQVTVDIDHQEIADLKLTAYYYLAQLLEGESYAKHSLELFHSGDKKWFQFMELYLLLQLKGESFEQATQTYREIRTNKNYSQLDESAKSRWQLYRVYLLYMHEHKLLRWGFDLDRFLNALPENNTESPSHTVSTLIIQIMFFLRRGEAKKVIDHVHKLDSYNSPHLDKRHNYRNSIFIRLLNIMTKEEFNHQLVKEKGSNYYSKLRKTGLSVDTKNGLEVIPYESLWRYILEILRTNKVYQHYRFYQLS